MSLKKHEKEWLPRFYEENWRQYSLQAELEEKRAVRSLSMQTALFVLLPATGSLLFQWKIVVFEKVVPAALILLPIIAFGLARVAHSLLDNWDALSQSGFHYSKFRAKSNLAIENRLGLGDSGTSTVYGRWEALSKEKKGDLLDAEIKQLVENGESVRPFTNIFAADLREFNVPLKLDGAYTITKRTIERLRSIWKWVVGLSLFFWASIPFQVDEAVQSSNSAPALCCLAPRNRSSHGLEGPRGKRSDHHGSSLERHRRSHQNQEKHRPFRPPHFSPD